jgi:hypothetical protein
MGGNPCPGFSKGLFCYYYYYQGQGLLVRPGYGILLLGQAEPAAAPAPGGISVTTSARGGANATGGAGGAGMRYFLMSLRKVSCRGLISACER